MQNGWLNQWRVSERKLRLFGRHFLFIQCEIVVETSVPGGDDGDRDGSDGFVNIIIIVGHKIGSKLRSLCFTNYDISNSKIAGLGGGERKQKFAFVRHFVSTNFAFIKFIKVLSDVFHDFCWFHFVQNTEHRTQNTQQSNKETANISTFQMHNDNDNQMEFRLFYHFKCKTPSEKQFLWFSELEMLPSHISSCMELFICLFIEDECISILGQVCYVYNFNRNCKCNCRNVLPSKYYLVVGIRCGFCMVIDWNVHNLTVNDCSVGTIF